jgi:aquaporin Z
MNKYLTEFIGTFFLCLVASLVIVRDYPMPALPIGVTLMVMVYMGGHISGGHYNPAVSLAAMMRGALPSGQFVPYLVSQFLGAIAAGMLTGVFTGDVMSPSPNPDANILLAVLAELLFTFALCLVVLNTATSPKTQGNSYFGGRGHGWCTAHPPLDLPGGTVHWRRARFGGVHAAAPGVMTHD